MSTELSSHGNTRRRDSKRELGLWLVWVVLDSCGWGPLVLSIRDARSERGTDLFQSARKNRFVPSLPESGGVIDQFLTALRKATRICNDIFHDEDELVVCLRAYSDARISSTGLLRNHGMTK